MKKPDNFIIIDDDQTTNMLCEIIIRRALSRDTKIKSFILADDGVKYLKDEYENSGNDLQTVMFLDINMPITTGWETLILLQELDERITKQLTVFMLSSSIDPNDKLRAMRHPLVFDFIEKPLTGEKIGHIFSK